MADHADLIEALETGGTPPGASSAEVVGARSGQTDLSASIQTADQHVGDGILKDVLDDFETVEDQAAPDDTVTVKAGAGVINGLKVREAATQTVDPIDFTLGETNPRIDVLAMPSTGTVAVTTGTPAATPLPERHADNTVPISVLFLRPNGANPNEPLPIRDVDNGVDSFIELNTERFLEEKDETGSSHHPHNLIRNGAFLTVQADESVTGWTATNLDTFERSTIKKLFGDFAARIVGAGGGPPPAGLRHIEAPIPFLERLKGRFVRISVYVQLAAGVTGKTGRITLRQEGDSPAADFSDSFTVNDQGWVRMHVQGFIDNETTTAFLRVEADTTDSNITEAFFDGAQVTPGKELSEFENPPGIRQREDGSVAIVDLTLEGDLVVEGSTLIKGDEDSESMILALAAQ